MIHQCSIEPVFGTKHIHTADAVLELIRKGPVQFRTLAPSRKSTTKVRITARAAISELEDKGLIRLVHIGHLPYYATAEWDMDPANKVLHIQGLTRHSVCGCHIWEGYLDKQRGPMVRFNREPARGVRRILWEQHTGKALTKDEVVKVTCEDERCVNPLHFKVIIRNTDRAGEEKTIVTKMRMSEAMRKRQGKLTPEQIEEIRQSDEPNKVVAARMGVTPSNIGLIRTHRIHKDYTSPFVGMFASLAANDSGKKRA